MQGIEIVYKVPILCELVYKPENNPDTSWKNFSGIFSCQKMVIVARCGVFARRHSSATITSKRGSITK